MATTERLKYFLELGNHKTFNETADALHISTSALRIAIKNLEEELGLMLIVKRRNEIVFSENGKELLIIISDFFTSIASLKVRQKTINASYILNGKINIYSTEGVIYNALPVILPTLYSFPNLEITLKHKNYIDLISMLENKKIEFAFLFQVLYNDEKNLYRIPPQLKFHPLFNCKLLYHVPERIRDFLNYSSLNSEDIKNHTIIYNLSKSENDMLIALDSLHQQRKVIFEENLSLFTSYLEHGIGIGQTLYSNFNPHIPSGFKHCYTLPSSDPITISFGYFVNSDYPLSELSKNLLRYIDSYISMIKDV